MGEEADKNYIALRALKHFTIVFAVLNFFLFFILRANAQVSDSSLLFLPNEISDKEAAVHLEKLIVLTDSLMMSRPDLAAPYLKISIELARQLNDSVFLADAYGKMGVVFNTKGKYTQSLKYYLSSLEIWKALDVSVNITVTENNIGLIYYEIDQKEKALKYWTDAKEIAEREGYVNLKAGLLNNIGEIHFDLKNYSLALESYTRALNIYSKETNNSIYAELESATPLHNIGRVYAEMGRFEEAIEYYQQALSIDIKNNFLEGVSLDYFEMGKVYRKAKLYSRATEHFKQSLEAASKMENYPIIADNLLALSQLAEDQGNFQEATSYFDLYQVYKDSLLNESVHQEITEIQAVFDANQQEKEIELLKLENELNEIKYRQRSFFIYTLGIIAVSLIVIALVFLFRYRLKIKSKIQLDEVREVIQHQNSELEQANARLTDNEQRLSELNATKDKFFSIISHDLKSPLRSLSGLLRILIDHGQMLSKEEFLELTTKLDHSVSGLSNLLENLLQWSNAQMGKVSYCPTNFYLIEVVRETAALLKLDAENKEIKLKLANHATIPVYADRDMIRFIIRNLLANAIKFTRRKGLIQLNVYQENRHVIFEVIDNGVGMDKEKLSMLFKPNKHLTTPGTEKESGTGLGLLLSKEFVHKNNGEIQVTSCLKQGTTFRVTLPTVEEAVVPPSENAIFYPKNK